MTTDTEPTKEPDKKVPDNPFLDPALVLTLIVSHLIFFVLIVFLGPWAVLTFPVIFMVTGILVFRICSHVQDHAQDYVQGALVVLAILGMLLGLGPQMLQEIQQKAAE